MARRLLFLIFAVFLLTPCEMKRRLSQPTEKQLTLQRRETTPVDFTRLVVMRLVYGLAKVLGFEEPVSEVLNGAFVPPGVDVDDDDFGDDDDDDGSFFDDY